MKKQTNESTCTQCGLCCVSFLERDVFCDLFREDIPQIPKEHRKWISLQYELNPDPTRLVADELPVSAALKTKIVKPRGGPLKGRRLRVCALLDGTPGKKTQCVIYKQRPFICRESVKPGDAVCQWTRKKGSEKMGQRQRAFFRKLRRKQKRIQNQKALN